jgi:hypothetical protein
MNHGVVTDLMIGRRVKENATVVPVPFLVIQDGKSHDFITGCTAACHQAKRISVYCTCPQSKADDVYHICTHVEARTIKHYARFCTDQHNNVDEAAQLTHILAAKNHAVTFDGATHFSDNLKTPPENPKTLLKFCREWLTTLSQHESFSPFHDLFLCSADPFGLFQASPVDMMHAFLLGICKYVTKVTMSFFLPSSSLAMDDYVMRKIGRARQSARPHFPRANFVKKFSNLKVITAEEWDGIAFTLFLYLQTQTGTDSLSRDLVKRNAHPDRPSANERVHGIVLTLSEMLCFVAWTRHGPFGFAGDSIGSGAALDYIHQRILLMLRNIKEFIP